MTEHRCSVMEAFCHLDESSSMCARQAEVFLTPSRPAPSALGQLGIADVLESAANLKNGVTGNLLVALISAVMTFRLRRPP